jgi:2-phospho-L-lactate transferase/gluconeogenesis factor (CofD/UPF0052 family)
MNILIFSGGTGSVATQTGFRMLYGDSLDVRIITNTLDNGKSTGTVRKVLDGKINGPSDLRKNQVLRYELQGGNRNLIELLNTRFDCEAKDAEEYCINRITKYRVIDERLPRIDPLAISTMLKAVDSYFYYPKSTQVDYVDFSLANIIYAGLAAENSSLVEAGKIMARNVLDIPEDAVIVADDNSLYLQARTESGKIIQDEGDIVDWNDANDKIVDTFFTDVNGRETLGRLSREALIAIHEADIIIFSSGTQWSSLIPTYQHYLFKEALEQAEARKYLIVNNVQDKDMTGVSASEMLSLLGKRFLPLDDITCIFNNAAVPEMRVDKDFMDAKGWKFLTSDLSTINTTNQKTHDGRKLVKLLMRDYYGTKLSNGAFIFDYDDTLIGRNSTFGAESKANRSMLLNLTRYKNKFFSICTGNTIRAVNFSNDRYVGYSSLNIFSEGGVNHYVLSSEEYNEEISSHKENFLTLSPRQIVDDQFIFSQPQIDKIMETLENVGINLSKIQNRNDAIISIKPIDPEYRATMVLFIRSLFPLLFVRASGRTTIDISKGASKTIILPCIPSGRITALGDESMLGGNDHSLSIHSRIDFIPVKNPRDTNVFLSTLTGFIADQNAEQHD